MNIKLLIKLVTFALSLGVGYSITILKLPFWFVVLMFVWAFLISLLMAHSQWEKDHPNGGED